MIKIISLALLAFLFVSCSSRPSYVWKANSKNYLEKYKQMMLQGDGFQAQYYLKDAQKQAQNDASFQTQAIISLTACAMEFSVGSDSIDCSEYLDVKFLFPNEKLESFYQLIYKKELQNSSMLGKYEGLYKALKNHTINNDSLDDFEDIYSFAIASMLIYKDAQINKVLVQQIIEKASQYDMHALMIVWMKILKEFSSEEEMLLLEKKLLLLK